MNWLDETISNGLKELNGNTEYKREYAFTRASVGHIPYIPYIGLNETECQFIQEQVADALRTSIQNGYKEVAITFDVKQPQKLIKVTGDYTSVPLLENEDVKRMLSDKGNVGNSVIVTIHNHPTDSIFSINDVMVFTENPNIKLMNIVNRMGEVSFLLRSDRTIDTHNYVNSHIAHLYSDYAERFSNWKEANPLSDFKFSDIFNLNERINIIQDCLNDMEKYGIYYNDYVNEREAKLLIFKPLENVGEQAVIVNDVDMNVNSLNVGDYYENDEDGYDR